MQAGATSTSHDWSIEGPFGEKAIERTWRYLPTAWMVQEEIRLPEARRDKIILLEFDGVYQTRGLDQRQASRIASIRIYSICL